MKPAASGPVADSPEVFPIGDHPQAGIGVSRPRDAKTAPKAIFVTLRKCLAMIPRGMRWKWALLAPLQVLTGITEAGAAAAVFALIKIIEDPVQMARIPIVSRIATAFPHASPERQILILTLLLAGYYLVKNLLAIEGQYLRHKVTGESIAVLKSTMLQRYLAAPYLFHLSRNSADVIWHTSSCVETICEDGMTAALAASSEILTTVAITCVLLFTAPKITLIAGALLLAVLAVFLHLTRHMAERLGRGRRDLERASLQTLQEALGGIKEIKALGREELFYRNFRDQQMQVMNLGYIGKTLENVTPLITETIFVCGALAVIALATGVGSARAGGLPLMALFGYAAFRIVPAANRISWQINRVRSAGSAVDSLYDDFILLTGADWGPRAEDKARGLVFNDRIVLEHLTFRFPNTQTHALYDICLTIKRGESIAIVGHTGAGKSTLVDLVVGLLRPSSGSILIDGVDLNDNLNSWRHCVGYVPQGIFLTDDSLRRNVALGIDDQSVDERRVVMAVQMAQLEHLVAGQPLGLDALLGERGVRLSGGERQRVGIARALYHDPDLLVFDEATSALDLQTETALNNAMEAFHGRRTLLVVAHRLSSVRRCDRVIFLANGRIKGCGSWDELIRGDPEFRLFTMAQEHVTPALG